MMCSRLVFVCYLWVIVIVLLFECLLVLCCGRLGFDLVVCYLVVTFCWIWFGLWLGLAVSGLVVWVLLLGSSVGFLVFVGRFGWFDDGWLFVCCLYVR